MSFSKDSFIATQRFGFGPQQKDFQNINVNPHQWLRDQILSGQQTRLNISPLPTDQIVRDVTLAKKNMETRKDIRKTANKLYLEEMEARFNLAVVTDQPFIERLVQFWSNHFAVSYSNKPFVSAVVGSFEREAIRPHVLGKFSDMLLSSTQHPAMLIYLDNFSSIGPTSKVGARRKRGLNENLGREILELHTLGVNGGYRQKDVLALAKIITGWSIAPVNKNGGGFQFVKSRHEPTPQVLLGKSYPDTGYEQGVSALTDLAHHPSTAKFIATKLVRHFVNDDPPPAAVARIEQVFLHTQGDLRAVSLALIDLDEAWEVPKNKMKTPYDMIVSSFRLVGVDHSKMKFQRVLRSLKILDQQPFTANSPAGWPDTRNDWMSPNAIINRVEWSQAFAQTVAIETSPLDLAKESIGGIANADTLLWIERAPSAKEGLALLLASPEWQQR